MSYIQSQQSKTGGIDLMQQVSAGSVTDPVETGYLLDGVALPFVIRGREPFSLIDWAKLNSGFLEKELLKAGAILFRNCGISTAEEFECLIETVSGDLLDYSYRSTPRTQVNGKIYTSTEYPPHQSIPLHNENAYSRSWPMRLWFYSLQVAPQGGATPIADSRQIYQSIPADIRDCFVDKGLMYVRNYGTGLDLPWQEVFQTTSRTAVEAYCQGAGIEIEWIGAEQLRTRQCCQVVERHPQTGEMVWFNQAHLFHVSRVPSEVRDWLLSEYGERNLPRNVYHADGSPIDPAMLDEVSAVLEQQSVVFQWLEGDVLLLDNMLAAHGRQAFRGKRRVVVGMAEANQQSLLNAA
jgi:alpha-ketoglutarate-dependent taurine dioxygenase